MNAHLRLRGGASLRAVTAVAVLLALGAALLAARPAGGAGKSAPQHPAKSQAKNTTAPPQRMAAGYTVHKDPATGKLSVPAPAPAETPLNDALREALSTSSEGLVEESSPATGGGTMVHLRGRFQDAMVGSKGADGRAAARCIGGVPPAERAKAAPAKGKGE